VTVVCDTDASMPWRRRIFCQFDRERYRALDAALGQLAEENGCDLWHGDAGSADLYAVGGFVLILDRGFVGDEAWGDYVAMYGADADATPCFVIDGRTDLPLPAWPSTKRIDMSAPDAVPTIVDEIRRLRQATAG
jgi:hypothetical protein